MSKRKTEGITEPQARTLKAICQILDSTGLPPTVKELAEALRDDAGAIVALHGTLQDVSAERALEELRTQRAITIPLLKTMLESE